MIELKDLQNRVYENKDCIAFDYELLDSDEKREKKVIMEARFKRAKEEDKTWRLMVVFPRTEMSDSQVYFVVFQMPKSNMNLPLICATGLRFFQIKLKEEIQEKVIIDFEIGNITEGM